MNTARTLSPVDPKTSATEIDPNENQDSINKKKLEQLQDALRQNERAIMLNVVCHKEGAIKDRKIIDDMQHDNLKDLYFNLTNAYKDIQSRLQQHQAECEDLKKSAIEHEQVNEYKLKTVEENYLHKSVELEEVKKIKEAQILEKDSIITSLKSGNDSLINVISEYKIENAKKAKSSFESWSVLSALAVLALGVGALIVLFAGVTILAAPILIATVVLGVVALACLDKTVRVYHAKKEIDYQLNAEKNVLSEKSEPGIGVNESKPDYSSAKYSKNFRFFSLFPVKYPSELVSPDSFSQSHRN